MTWFLIWAVVITTHVLSYNKQRWDSSWTLHAAYSLWTSGKIDLSEFAHLIDDDDYQVLEIDGRLVTRYPLGAVLLAAPVVGMIDFVERNSSSDSEHVPMENWNLSDVQEAIASIIVASTSLLIGLIGWQLGLAPRTAMLLALIAAFGTPLWSTMSRALWSHTAAALFVTGAIACLLAGHEHRRRIRPAWISAGVLLGLAFISRPTAAIPVAALTALAFIWDRRSSAWVVGGGALVAVLFLLHSLQTYGTVLPPYYLPSRAGDTSAFGEALIGNLVSPSRGLLLYMPIWILSAIGITRLWKSHRGLAVVIVVASTIHWLLVSRVGEMWWGGWAYGPRLMSDVVPLLMVGLAGFLRDLRVPISRSEWVGLALAGVLLSSSVAIQFAGANFGGTVEWHVTPVRIEDDSSRLWDWSDPQMLRRSGMPARVTPVRDQARSQ